MTDLRKAAEMALEFVEWLRSDDHSVKPKNNALKTKEALRQALAESANSTTDFVEPKASSQPEQEPVAWMHNFIEGTVITHEPADIDRHPDRWTPLYTAPPKREWVGLSDEEIDAAVKSCNTLDTYKYFRTIEAKLKEKNT